MLKKISCNIFLQKEIVFHEGLNAIVGDDIASNSIGKSTMLMIIDFVFGGDDYINKNHDVVDNLGHHDFRFIFNFDNKDYYFIRSTNEYKFVSICNEKFEILQSVTTEELTAWLQEKYDCQLESLPDLIESKEWCSLSHNEELAYEHAVLSKNYAEARRVSWNVDDLKDSSKASRLLELVEEAESEDRKVIVFSFFLDTIRKVTMLLGNRCTNPINGSVTPQRRQEIIDEFDKAPAGTVLVAQIQSGGTGLNIQSASVVVLCEPQFKPSIENQAISRAYRMGQTRNVLVYRLLCEGTVDEKIMSTLESKQAIFDAFADKSVAAAESQQIDDRTFGNIIKEEIDRINAKYGNTK